MLGLWEAKMLARWERERNFWLRFLLVLSLYVSTSTYQGASRWVTSAVVASEPWDAKRACGARGRSGRWPRRGQRSPRTLRSWVRSSENETRSESLHCTEPRYDAVSHPYSMIWVFDENLYRWKEILFEDSFQRFVLHRKRRQTPRDLGTSLYTHRLFILLEKVLRFTCSPRRRLPATNPEASRSEKHVLDLLLYNPVQR